MKRRLVGCFLALALLVVSAAQAQEEKCYITRHSGEIVKNATITKMTKDVITVDVSGASEKVPVGDIKVVKFSGEPAEMDEVRDYLTDSRFEDMLDKLKTIDNDQLTTNMKKDRDFLIVRALAGRAFAGSLAISDAVKAFDKYFSDKDNQEFYRFYEASEIYGNLNMLIGTDEALTKAGKAFEMIGKAKDAPILKARGLVGVGNIAVLKKDAASAARAFKEVMTMVRNQEVEGVRTEMEVSAVCGLARADVLDGKADQAVKEIQGVFAGSKITAEDPLNALLYNALGYAQLAGKKPKDAAISYMHTHLLYNGNKQLHLEALDAMIQIFRVELRDEARAGDLETVKAERYGAKKK